MCRVPCRRDQAGEFTEPVGLGKDALHNMACGARAAPFDIEANARDVHERFEREAHLHTVIDAICF
jgi:hypothetical protein